MITKLGRPYAQSLLDTVGNARAAGGVLEELEAVLNATQQVPALHQMAANPGIPLEVKRNALREVCESIGVGQAVHRFLEVLLENYRLVNLAEIVESFGELVQRQMGVVTARVESAKELTAEQQDELQATLEQVTGHKIEMETTVDPELLGGFVATVGSRRFDTSVKGHLGRMAKDLAS